MLGTYRPAAERDVQVSRLLGDLQRTDGSTHIALSGLQPSEVSQYLELTVGAVPPEGVSTAVHEQTGGNPLFLRQLVHSFSAAGRPRDWTWLDRIADGQPPVIFGDGSQSMDMVYVEDIARANILAALSDVTDEVFNVGTATETTLRGLCDLLLELHGREDLTPVHEPERKVNPVRRRRSSIDKIRNMLGYEPKTSLQEGLLALMAWRKESLCLQ